jgi:acetyl esterase/lipase
MKIQLKLALVFSLATFWVLLGFTPQTASPTPVPSKTPTPSIIPTRTPDPNSKMDVVYCSPGHRDLKMDLHFPSGTGPWPVVVAVHGGGWKSGDKADMDLSSLTARGFAVASINYRLYPEYTFPAMIVDVKCAIRYLRANASVYHIDPDRVALYGHSAGGHLVALAGLADKSAGWDVGQYSDQSSRVQAVIDIAGPADLRYSFSDWVDDLVEKVFSTVPAKSGSPVLYVTEDDPPFLILQGDSDPVVPKEQSLMLYDRLRTAGVKAQLVLVKNGGHGLEPIDGPISPTTTEISADILDFLKMNLMGKGD